MTADPATPANENVRIANSTTGFTQFLSRFSRESELARVVNTFLLTEEHPGHFFLMAFRAAQGHCKIRESNIADAMGVTLQTFFEWTEDGELPESKEQRAYLSKLAEFLNRLADGALVNAGEFYEELTRQNSSAFPLFLTEYGDRLAQARQRTATKMLF